MASTVTLGPSPTLQLTNNSGFYVAYGSVRTLDWNTRQPKGTYFDPAGLVPRPNPFPLDSVGRAFEVYWETTSSYYLELLDQQGRRIWSTTEPYVPGSGGGGNVTTQIELVNLFINGQMRFFPSPIYSPIPSGTTPNVAEGGWSFLKNGTNLTDAINFTRFLADVTDVDASPTYYFNYSSAGAGVGETEKDLQYKLQDVRTLAGESISISWALQSGLAGSFPCEVFITQNFGTSSIVTPSTPVVTPVMTNNPTTTWQQFTATITVPNLVGKTIGTNGDDYLMVSFRFPLNINADIQAVNFYLKRGAASSFYPYLSYEEVDAQVKAFNLPNPASVTNFPTDYGQQYSEQAFDCITLAPLNGGYQQIWFPPVPVGTLSMIINDVAPPGWAVPEGQVTPRVGEFFRLSQLQYSNATFATAYGQPPNQILAVSSNIPASFIVISQESANLFSPMSVGNTGFSAGGTTFAHGFEVNVSDTSIPTVVVTNINNDAFGPVAATNTSMTLTIINNGGSQPAEWEITAIPATGIVGGQFIVYNVSTTPSLQQRYVYFIKDGIGANPNIPGATGYAVEISSVDSATTVAILISLAILGWPSYRFICLPASSLTPGMYFTVSNPVTEYNLYFRINGSSNAPGQPNLVPVEISSTATAQEVADALLFVLYPLLMQWPNYLGYFPRFAGGGVDPNVNTRTNRGDGTTGDNVGTFQGFGVQDHLHDAPSGTGYLYSDNTSPDFLAVSGSGRAYVTLGTTGDVISSTAETRPINVYLYPVIKY